MLDNLYRNIGKKIKNWAMWIFIIEAIGAIITGIALMVAYQDGMIFAGIATLFLGPIVAFVSSWILYAFGEIVDKLCEIERNTRGDSFEIEGEITEEEEQKQQLKEAVSKEKTLYDAEKAFESGSISQKEYEQIVECFFEEDNDPDDDVDNANEDILIEAEANLAKGLITVEEFNDIVFNNL